MTTIHLHLQSKDLRALASAAYQLAVEAMDHSTEGFEGSDYRRNTGALRMAADFFDLGDKLTDRVRELGGPTCFGILRDVDVDNILFLCDLLEDSQKDTCIRVLTHVAKGGYQRKRGN